MNSFDLKTLPLALPELNIKYMFEVPNNKKFFWCNEFVEQIFLVYYEFNNSLHSYELYISPSPVHENKKWKFEELKNYLERNIARSISIIRSSLEDTPGDYIGGFADRLDFEINLLKTLKDPAYKHVDLRRDIRLNVMRKKRASDISNSDLFNVILNEYDCNIEDFFLNNPSTKIFDSLSSYITLNNTEEGRR